MSFPKAKLKRFNEIYAPTPSPADYNIELKSKPILGVIPLSERFIDPKSPTPSETGSTKSTPCFRTPTLIKKKRINCNSAQKHQNSRSNDDYNKELLYEKTVECNNKNAFINELNEQIEELKNEIFKLDCEKRELSDEKTRNEEEIRKLNEIQGLSLKKISEEYETQIFKLSEQISELGNKIEFLQTEAEKFENLDEKLAENTKLIEELRTKLESAQNEKEQLVLKCQSEISNLIAQHDKELENLQFEVLKTVQEIQNKLDTAEMKYNARIRELQTKFQAELEENHSLHRKELEENTQNIARIKQLEENMSEIKLISEIQSKEKCTELETYWKGKLEQVKQESTSVLKECQAISEYTLIQSELEKNEYKLKYDRKTNDYNGLEKKYDKLYVNLKKLQESYSNLQNKLYRLMKELREKKELERELLRISNEKEKFEQTILRSQQTIEILKRRLTESDRDVEQLKVEITENESKMLVYEKQINELKNELEETNVEFKESTKQEIAKIRAELVAKVEQLKLETEKINKANVEKQNEIQKLSGMMREQQELNKNAQELIKSADSELQRLTEENHELTAKLERLTLENLTFQSEIQQLNEVITRYNIERKETDLKIDILKNELAQLRKHEENYKETLQHNSTLQNENLKKSAQLSELRNEIEKMKLKFEALKKSNTEQTKIIEEQKTLIEPFKEQLEAYELEMNNLKCAKDCMENEAKDLGSKYAQTIGHQNHKQKIKYMEILKDKNEDLLKANLEYESKLRLQDKKLEKLRKENAELRRNKKNLFEDKENVASPNRSKCESPGPLREIN